MKICGSVGTAVAMASAYATSAKQPLTSVPRIVTVPLFW
jgi:hypothetical protein